MQWLTGLCIDTTSSNKEIHTGAITVIQPMLDKHLWFLACRHHILETVSSSVFNYFFKSSGQQVSQFSRFKEQWMFIDTTQYSSLDVPTARSALTDTEIEWLCSRKDNIICFLKNYLDRGRQPRQDYLEFAKLSLVMLNNPTDSRVHFSPPCAYHRAHWIAKGMYSYEL